MKLNNFPTLNYSNKHVLLSSSIKSRSLEKNAYYCIKFFTSLRNRFWNDTEGEENNTFKAVLHSVCRDEEPL